MDSFRKMSLVILKPEARSYGLIGKILSRFEDKGFTFTNMKMLVPSDAQIMAHYKEHEGKDFYHRLFKQFQGHTILVVKVDHPNILDRAELVKSVRTLVGKVDQPGTIRGDFSRSFQLNTIHASDSVMSAIEECSIWLDA